MMLGRAFVVAQAAALLCWGAVSPALSQIQPTPGQFGFPPGVPDTTGTSAPLPTGGISGSVDPLRQSGPLLDQPISRSEYVLGPGDLLILSIFGFRSQTFSLSVSPEGSIVIPSVGVIEVGGLTIEQAEREAAIQVSRAYVDVRVSLTLAAVRSFKVFVVGDVPSPGVREANAVTRVSEIIPHTDSRGVIHRNVTVRRASGETLPVDLAVFLQLGDLGQNPVLRDGDIITVPTIDETISISGTVAYPGTYAYREGETLAGLLRIANGGERFPSNAADTVRVMRFNRDPRGEVMAMAKGEALGTVGQHTSVEPFDAVFVPRLSNFREQTTATIEGEVLRPGRYPIRPGETTVRELVEMAGGFTSDASLLDAVLRREPVVLPRDSLRLLDNVPPELLSREEQRIRQVTQLADDRNVVVDFRRLFNGEDTAYDLPLVQGDHLYVPEHRNEITVLGAVIQPGILEYVPEQDIEYFIRLAGGYSERADRGDLVVVKARLGNQLRRNEVTELEPGDRIIVPFREPRTFLERVQTVEGVISTISGLVLTIVGLERLWETITN